MNFGIYGFPSTYGLATSSIISVTEFDASGTYVIPANAAFLQVLVIGGGGGGGGGGQGGTTTTVAYGGGGGGGGGSVIYTECLVSELGTGTRLNVQIGQGGNGGSRASGSTNTTVNSGGDGVIGSASSITIPGRPGFYIRALGGAAGLGGRAGSAAGAASGGGGRSSSFNGVPMSNVSGANGSWNQAQNANSGFTGSFVYIQDQRCNGGAAGGNIVSTTTAQCGGSIEIINLDALTTSTQIPILYDMVFTVLGASGQGITAVYGGLTGTVSDATRAAGGNGIMIFSSMKHLGGGAGGAGGGASIGATAGVGGNGYRGGGGGGGGAARGTGTAGGTGGVGGNGYCCIVARG